MKNTFVDEKGEYGEQGQEYLFHPGKDKEKQEEIRQKSRKTQENTEKTGENKNTDTKQAGLPIQEKQEEEQKTLFKGDNV